MNQKNNLNNHEPVQLRPLEVTLAECRGNFNKMIKRFNRKVKKEEVLSPFYGRLASHKTRGQKRRDKRLKGAWLHKKKKMKQEKSE